MKIVGRRIGGKLVKDESDHMEPCPACGQSFDARDLAQVMHHAKPGHEPLSGDETMRVVRGTLRN